MTTELKLRLLAVCQEITAINKTLLELANDVEDTEVFRAIDNLLKAASHINNAVKN